MFSTQKISDFLSPKLDCFSEDVKIVPHKEVAFFDTEDLEGDGVIITDGTPLIPAYRANALESWWENDLTLKNASFYLLVNADGKIETIGCIGTPDYGVLSNFIGNIYVPNLERVLMVRRSYVYNYSMKHTDDRYWELKKKKVV